LGIAAVCAFFGREAQEELADGEANGFDRSGGSFSEEVLELGEEEGAD